MEHRTRNRITAWLLLLLCSATACSDSVTRPTPITEPPPPQVEAPSNLVLTALSASRIMLGWTDNAASETGFRIERCIGAGCADFTEIATIAANAVQYTDTGLSAVTTYRYRVRAYGASATSAYSNAAAIATRAADLLADLAMDSLSDFQISVENGRRLLRFSTTIVNVGEGPFEVRGQRTSATDTLMPVTHRIYDASGAWRDVAIASVLEYSGDGHDHWHIRALQVSDLLTADGTSLVRGNKQGFCFWDNAGYRLTLPGAPQAPVYRRGGCGHHHEVTVAMGLSIGWGDTYSYSLANQYVDVTGIADGRYRLVVTADPENWFEEAIEDNNLTWVDLEIWNGGLDVRILAYGPRGLMAHAREAPGVR
jgi:hypothetical protein